LITEIYNQIPARYNQITEFYNLISENYYLIPENGMEMGKKYSLILENLRR
jgi:hypothetical protein